MRSLRENLPYKLLALVLSVALWANVKLRQEPFTLPVQVRLQVRSVGANLVTTPSITQVTAVLYGPKVYTNSVDPAEIVAYLDMADAVPGQGREEVKVILPRRLQGVVNVLSVAPERVDVRVRRKISKSVPVAVEWTGPALVGARYNVPRLEPSSVTVTGPDTAVEEVQRARVSVRAGDPHVNGRYPAVPVDDRGETVSEVSLAPDAVGVDATLTQTQGRQQALVSPAFAGTPAPGHALNQVATTPQVVTLLGPPEVLRTITSVTTESINIAGARGQVSRPVGLLLPEGVTSVPARVQVTVRITPPPRGADRP